MDKQELKNKIEEYAKAMEISFAEACIEIQVAAPSLKWDTVKTQLMAEQLRKEAILPTNVK